jgi:hypothetical protein
MLPNSPLLALVSRRAACGDAVHPPGRAVAAWLVRPEPRDTARDPDGPCSVTARSHERRPRPVRRRSRRDHKRKPDARRWAGQQDGLEQSNAAVHERPTCHPADLPKGGIPHRGKGADQQSPQPARRRPLDTAWGAHCRWDGARLAPSEAKVHNSRLLIRVLLRRLDDVIDLVVRDLDVERPLSA